MDDNAQHAQLTVDVPITVDVPVSVSAPHAARVEIIVEGDITEGDMAGDAQRAVQEVIPLQQVDGRWHGVVRAPVGTRYWLRVDGGDPVVDPSATRITMTPDGPRCVVSRPWPQRARLGYHHDVPVIYELHVKGFGGSFAGVGERLDHLVALGVDVIELMPVHPFDTSDNYWGYMPIVWGAVHEGYAPGADPATELADLIGAAHECGLEVWLDVVVNHTAEGAPPSPTWSLRGLDERDSYLVGDDGVYDNASGTGNTVNPSSPEVRRLIFEALERYAALGVDGFRFDLAAVLTAHGPELVTEIADWAKYRDLSLVAEPWDLQRYLVGSDVWPAHWRQWNDRFREDVRAVLHGDAARAASLVGRLDGSHDLFGPGGWFRSVNYVTSHDGMTLYDLVAYDDGSHGARAYPPAERTRQVMNAMVALLMSAGAVMMVAGDEFCRTQRGDPNPYDRDDEVSWVDWGLAAERHEVTAFVALLLRLRHRHPIHSVRPLGAISPSGAAVLSWTTGDLAVMWNSSPDAVTFELPESAAWRLAAWSARPEGCTLAPRSAVVWERRPGR